MPFSIVVSLLPIIVCFRSVADWQALGSVSFRESITLLETRPGASAIFD